MGCCDESVEKDLRGKWDSGLVKYIDFSKKRVVGKLKINNMLKI